MIKIPILHSVEKNRIELIESESPRSGMTADVEVPAMLWIGQKDFHNEKFSFRNRVQA